MMRLPWTMLLVGFLLSGTLCAEPRLEQFFAQNCVKCHGPEKQKGEVRFDKPFAALIADEELLETIATVLEAGEMPPEEAPQPTAEAVAEVVQMLQDIPQRNGVKGCIAECSLFQRARQNVQPMPGAGQAGHILAEFDPDRLPTVLLHAEHEDAGRAAEIEQATRRAMARNEAATFLNAVLDRPLEQPTAAALGDVGIGLILRRIVDADLGGRGPWVLVDQTAFQALDQRCRDLRSVEPQIGYDGVGTAFGAAT